MTYDPSGQQGQYQQQDQQSYQDPYQQQQYQAGYQQQQPQQYQYYQVQAPPAKSNTGLIVAIVIIVVVLVIIVPVVAAYMMFWSMEQSSGPGPGDYPPAGTFVTSTFANPDDDVTTNNGGWSVKVTSISGSKPEWSDITLTLKSPSGVNVKRITGVESWGPNILSYEGSALNWYLLSNGNPRYSESDVSLPISGNEDSISGIEFNTIEDAWLVAIDNDGDSKLSPNDIVMVYKDNNGDGSDDVESGYSLEFNVASGAIGASPLY